ncbi:MAG: hypothetical protein V1772_00965 [Chloroflexota bacterium]
MRRSERLGITISLVVLGLIAATIIPLPARELRLEVLGSELRLSLSGAAQLTVLMVMIVVAGVDATIRSNPQHAGRSLAYTATFWMAPSLLVLISLALVRLMPWWGYRLGLIAVSGAALSWVIFTQYGSVDPAASQQRAATLLLNATVYLLALVALIYLYGLGLRSLVSATGVLILTTMLALELLRSANSGLARLWLYAIAVGVMLAETTWALNYLSVDARLGGGFLFLVFYALTGLSMQHLWGRLSPRGVAEYGAIFAAWLAVLALVTL